MTGLYLLHGLKIAPAPIRDYWEMKEENIPPSPGVYILLSKPTISFQYPRGRSPIYYIGQASDLRKRLRDHLRYSRDAKNDRRNNLYWPRYEYAAAFGGRYTFIRTWKGMTPKNLEDSILAQFAEQHRSFPVANSAGSWTKIGLLSNNTIQRMR